MAERSLVFPAPPQGYEFVGTSILACRIQRTGIGIASKVSDKLPYPAIITSVEIWGNTVATGLADTIVLCELTQDNAVRASHLPVQDGDLFDFYPFGGSFDPANEAGLGYAVFNTTQSHTFDVWWPVPASTWRVRTSLVQQTAITPRVQVTYTIKKLRRIIADPSEGIVPRGTPEDPVCVNICGGGTPPTPPGGGGGGPPPPPPPPPTGGRGALDPTQPPLPDASEIDPLNPDNELAYQCAIDRLDRG